MNERFLELFHYDRAMNQEFIDLVNDPDIIRREEFLKLMSHIINAKALWLARIEGKKPPYGIWTVQSPMDLEKIDKETFSQIQDLLENEENIDRIIEYTNSAGKTHFDRLPDILFHLINHGTHHRAQLAMMTRKLGQEPPVSDYIFWCREG